MQVALALLDHYRLTSVAWLGTSMGGLLGMLLGILLGILLVLHVALHAVMQLQHEVIVFATEGLGHMQRLEHAGLPAHIRFGTRQKALRHGLERLAHAPDARRLRIDVVEHAQQALAGKNVAAVKEQRRRAPKLAPMSVGGT